MQASCPERSKPPPHPTSRTSRAFRTLSPAQTIRFIHPSDNFLFKGKMVPPPATTRLRRCCSVVVTWKVRYKHYICIMAVVQYTGVVNQIRGKLNGSVFNKYKTGFSLTRKQQPPAGFRGNQLQRRSGFSRIQRLWKTLTTSQQNSWIATANNNPVTNRFGETVYLSGYNYFIKANLKLLQQADSTRLTASGTASPSSGLLSTVLSNYAFYYDDAEGAIMSLHVAATVFPWFSGIRLAVYVSVPQSTGVTNYQRGYRYLDSLAVTNNVSADLSGVLGKRYPALAPGSVLFFIVETWHIETGATLYREQIRFVVPQTSELSSWSAAPSGMGSNININISYSPSSTGYPPFQQLIVKSAVLDSPPAGWDDLTRREPGIETVLANANTATTARSAAPGQYISYGVQLVWSPTGEVLDQRISTFQVT